MSEPIKKMPAGLVRYREILDDPAALLEVSARPLPTCIWTNADRVSPQDLDELLRDDGLEPVPIPWRDDAFRLGAVEGVGNRWWFRAGLCHVQEEVSMLPAKLLDPQPGERVLDLCAAPGGKTAQLALAVGAGGTVIANDANAGRMRALRAVVDRLGLANVTLTHRDGCQYSPRGGTFDRILVDAPCSDEGTLRKNPNLVDALGTRPRRERTSRQAALLRKAVQLCRPGGRVVYSTCTFAPEENEGVVDEVLQAEARCELELLEVSLPGLRTCPGITAWEDRRFDATLTRAVRVWPHHNDTGGFFVAVLRKGADPVDRNAPPRTIEPAPAEAWQPYTVERFGFPEAVWQELLVHRRTTRGLHVTNRAQRSTERPEPHSIGLLLVKDRIQHPKLTTAGALLLGRHATRNVVELSPEQLDRYHERESFPLEPAQREACTGTGYVVVRYRGHAMGTGLYVAAAGTLQSLFPQRGYPGRTGKGAGGSGAG